MRKVLGIDPGLSGGLSIIDEQLNLIACYHMPTIKADGGKSRVCPKTINSILKEHQIDLAIIEKVGARPGQGVVSMFNFGDSFGVARAIAEANCGQIVYARPQEWRGYQMLSGLSKEQIAEIAYEVFQAEEIYGRKNRSGNRAVKDGISDSLMIAKYGIRFLE